jgi:UDP-glucose 4-epimerase
MKNVLLIGAASSIGRAISAQRPADLKITPLVRDGAGFTDAAVVDDYLDIPAALFEGIDVVINCVGVTRNPANGPRSMIDLNVKVPVNAAVAAKRAGVGQFIHFSSISLYGRCALIDETTGINPVTDYGRSKAQADEALAALADDSFRVCLIRPPIVYGAGAGAKIIQLISFMRKFGFFVAPQPPALRSAVHVRNLVAWLLRAIEGNVTGPVLVSDREPFSIDMIAALLGGKQEKPVRLLRLPRVCFFPVKLLAPGLYASLFAPQLVEARWQVMENATLPVPVEEGIAELIALGDGAS